MEALIQMKKIENNKTSNPFSAQLPQLLKTYRENAGLSLRDVSKKIKKSAASICKWESGEVTPYGDVLLKLCDIYNVDVTDFFGLNTTENIRITPKEIELIELYRNATKHAQITTRTVLENCQNKKEV